MCCYCILWVVMAYWSYMWFIGIISGHNCWLCPFFGSLYCPSGVMDAIPQAGDFRVSPSLGPLGSVSRVYGVFSNRDHLPSTSGPLHCFKKELVIFFFSIFIFYFAYCILPDTINFLLCSWFWRLDRVIFLVGGERRVIALTTFTRS